MASFSSAKCTSDKLWDAEQDLRSRLLLLQCCVRVWLDGVAKFGFEAERMLGQRVGLSQTTAEPWQIVPAEPAHQRGVLSMTELGFFLNFSVVRFARPLLSL